ncbi:MAG: hypothetical protein ACI9SG_000416 [Maribacter sp.]
MSPSKKMLLKKSFPIWYDWISFGAKRFFLLVPLNRIFS